VEYLNVEPMFTMWYYESMIHCIIETLHGGALHDGALHDGALHDALHDDGVWCLNITPTQQ
jgi:hypothetical protein